MVKNSKNPVQIRWALLCKNASVDQRTNTISLFNIVEEFTVNKGPLGTSMAKRVSSSPEKTAVAGEFALVVKLERTSDSPITDAGLKISIVDSFRKELQTNEVPLKFEEGKQRLRFIVNFGSF